MKPEQDAAKQDAQDAAAEPNGQAAADAGAAGAATPPPAPEAPAEQDPITRLEAEVSKLRAALTEQYDKHLRLQAELDNYKKRVQREQAESLKYALLPLMRELAGTLDNLERALGHSRAPDGADASGLAAGIEMVVKQLAETCERFGMVRVQAAGQPFDPTRHQAVVVVDTDQVPENQVLEELQAGYVLHDRVVRPAMVSVAKRNSGGGPAGDTPAN
jgi:molecular chaperone GrpE